MRDHRISTGACHSRCASSDVAAASSSSARSSPTRGAKLLLKSTSTTTEVPADCDLFTEHPPKATATNSGSATRDMDVVRNMNAECRLVASHANPPKKYAKRDENNHRQCDGSFSLPERPGNNEPPISRSIEKQFAPRQQQSQDQKAGS